MTVAENLLVAKFRGEKRGLIPRHLASYKEEFKQSLLRSAMAENHIDTAVELSIRGNDKPWSLLDMDTETSRTLLLDEHTAALDPKPVQCS